jgi:hypothetical protein
MNIGIGNRDTVGVEPGTSFPSIREANTRRRTAEPRQNATAKQPLQIDGEIEPLCAQCPAFPDPTSHRHINRPDTVNPLCPFDKVSPLALHNPREM